MTHESIARVQASHQALASESVAMSSRFYEEMFKADPTLRPLFPSDLSGLQKHFEAALALIVRNLHEMDALADALRDLGAQHVEWRARPDDYAVARDALLTAIRSVSPTWSDQLEADWRAAIQMIVVRMLQGAAVETAVAAERFAAEP